ncbi:hypothetical protein [Flavobacterium aestivum]|uniref:hypothetical protein n=1 Tax=Flavobacterium aestivum TaxID=3003257 RepID=UPI002285B26A|nr:hypothetical protein [Flavobacterium aestivum]
MEVVAYRGLITTLDSFIERLQGRGEITTQDILDNASIAYFTAKNLDYKSAEIHKALMGIGKGEITLIKKEDLTKFKAVIKPNPETNFLNHALLSNISAQNAFIALKSSGVHFVYDGGHTKAKASEVW